LNAVAYPRLIKRVRAVLIDSVLVPVAAFGMLILGDTLGVSHPFGKVMLILVPILILEPGLVAFTGGTVGHHLLRIRVTRTDSTRNINIFAATVRFVVKLLLGWLSFIFVLTTAKHQAVHDLIARSVVVHKDATGLPAYDVLAERTVDSANYVYPSAWRRVVIIIAYALLGTVFLSVATALVSSTDCMESHKCTTLDKLFEMVLSVLWIVGIGWITVRGWNGMLYGCRRRQREAAS
jgi:uncharacterized RDD family membrane protein YckC